MNREIYDKLLADADPREVDLGEIGLSEGINKMLREPGWVIFSSLTGIVVLGDPDYPCRYVRREHLVGSLH